AHSPTRPSSRAPIANPTPISHLFPGAAFSTAGRVRRGFAGVRASAGLALAWVRLSQATGAASAATAGADSPARGEGTGGGGGIFTGLLAPPGFTTETGAVSVAMTVPLPVAERDGEGGGGTAPGDFPPSLTNACSARATSTGVWKRWAG